MSLSMYRQALQAKLSCPHCPAKNSRHQPPVIKLTELGVNATCGNCGTTGTFTLFLAEEPK